MSLQITTGVSEKEWTKKSLVKNKSNILWTPALHAKQLSYTRNVSSRIM